MLTSLSLHNFKNYKDKNFIFGNINVIFGSNGSGKTNILEAIYLSTNARTFLSKPITELVHFFEGNMIIAGKIEENELEQNFKITYDEKTKKNHFILNSSIVSKLKYLSGTNTTSIFFSPFEINILYLGPSFRREFFDETLELSFNDFCKIKSDYAKILKNRNKLLKNIFENKAKKDELHFWDIAFADATDKYYRYRKKFIFFIEENIKIIEGLLDNKYKLKFSYETKIDMEDVKNSVSSYLQKNIDRDIMLGHTYIGPHLDDFHFKVIVGKKANKSENYLSIGENKSILIGLKFLQIIFLQNYNKNDIILLLDDIFSELDSNHIALVMDKCKNYQTFITTQNIPSFLDKDEKITKIKLDL